MSMDKAIEHGKEHRKPWRGGEKQTERMGGTANETNSMVCNLSFPL